MKQYSFLLEIAKLTPPTRNAESEVGDPIGGVDQETESKRRAAKSIKADSELIAARAQLEKTKHDANKIKTQIQSEREEQKNAEIDKQRQLQQVQRDQMNQQAAPQQDPTMDPNQMQ